MNVVADNAEDRWSAAAKLADGVADEGERRRRRRVLILVSALIVGSWIVGFVLALVLLPSGRHHSDATVESSGQLVAQLTFLILGLVVGVGGFIWGRRTGQYVTRWRAVASPLNRAEKKTVGRQIAGKEKVDAERLPIVLAIAGQNRRSIRALVPIYSALVLFAIATAIGSNSLVIKLVELVAGLLFVVSAVIYVVAYRRAGRFIESNREPVAAR